MGLDITAYEKVKLVGACSSDDFEENYDWRKTTHVWPGYIIDPDFPQQLEGASILPDGVYEYAEKFDFRAGSYSGYNRWRAQLSEIFLGVQPSDVWANPSEFVDRPFYYLVNFSDCEGIISGSAAQKLAENFDQYADKVPRQDNRFASVYDSFAKAFKMASGDGFVRFH